MDRGRGEEAQSRGAGRGRAATSPDLGIAAGLGQHAAVPGRVPGRLSPRMRGRDGRSASRRVRAGSPVRRVRIAVRLCLSESSRTRSQSSD